MGQAHTVGELANQREELRAVCSPNRYRSIRDCLFGHGCAGAYHQQGRMQRVEHGVGGASKHNARQTAATVRRKHDQLTGLVTNSLGNCRCWIAERNLCSNAQFARP
jgi:hypothetical protein